MILLPFQMDQIHVKVHFDGKLIDLGEYEIECLSLVALINDVMEKVVNRHRLDDEKFMIMAQIPSSGAKQLLETDMELLSFVNLMLSRKITLLLLEMKSLPSEAMQSDILENHQTSFIPENSSENTLKWMFEAYEEDNKPTMADAIHHEQATNWTDEPLDNDDNEPLDNDDANSVDSINWTDDEIGEIVNIGNEDVENIIKSSDNSDFDNKALLSDYESGTNKAQQLIGQQQLSTYIRVKQSKLRSMQASQAQINQVVAQAPEIYGPQSTIGQQQQPAYIIARQRRARQGHDQGTGNNNNNGVINTEPVLKKVRKESKDRLNATQPSASKPDGFGGCM
ncbi:hypothetical protein WN943_029380 [Citrus x changshan-huyou]